MSSFNFNGPVNGPVQAGDRTFMQVGGNHFGSEGAASAAVPTAETLRLAAELVRLVREQAPTLQPQAEEIQGELVRAEESGAEPDRGRIRRWIDTLTAGLGAGTAALELAHQLGQAVSG